MSDLFISYSRDDRSFVEKLHESIKLTERDAWVDYSDIPKGEKFWDEITQGINGADTFVFIMSPSSVEKASREGDDAWCRREIEYAAEQNKRIIPIVYQEGFTLNKNILTNKILSERNWIFFNDLNKFDNSLKEFIESIEVDLSYVRKHTALTVAAKNWEQRGYRDKSTLLRGKLLAEAVKWLVKGEQKSLEQIPRKFPDPLPTSSHKQYIAASRKHARHRLISTLAVLLVPLSLSIPAENYWRAESIKRDYARLGSINKAEERSAVQNLTNGCRMRAESSNLHPYLITRLFGNCERILKTNLNGANLNLLDLAYTDLRSSNLEGADLMYATLNKTELNSSNLTKANLKSAKLTGANLNRANLNGADLIGAKIDGAAYLVGATFQKANLTLVDFGRADLREADFSGANMELSNLSGSQLYKASLRGSNLRLADLNKTSLFGVNLIDTNLTGVKNLRFIGNSNLKNANLQGADMMLAILIGSNFENADLRGTNLSQATFSCLKKDDAVLKDISLCPNLNNIQWDDKTNWDGVKGLETVENIPLNLKKKLGLR